MKKFPILNTMRKRSFWMPWLILLAIVGLIAILSSCEATTQLTASEVAERAENVVSVKIAPIASKIDTMSIYIQALEQHIAFQDSIINRLIVQDHILADQNKGTLDYVFNVMQQMNIIYGDQANLPPEYVDSGYVIMKSGNDYYRINLVRE